MIPFLKSILWDTAAARAALVGAATIGALFMAQPTGRTVEERLLTSVLGGLGTSTLAAGSPRSKAASEEIDDLKRRLAALEPPK